jgi:hypothetical protein
VWVVLRVVGLVCNGGLFTVGIGFLSRVNLFFFCLETSLDGFDFLRWLYDSFRRIYSEFLRLKMLDGAKKRKFEHCR